ncbi:MAG: hypothetical protein IPK04_13385 [Bdellovibrionales bacterium]|nr:hypothetical protein [Bdellovibrionales bacterium]
MGISFSRRARKFLMVLLFIVGASSVLLAQQKSAIEVMCDVADKLKKVVSKSGFKSCETPKAEVPPIKKIEPVYETCTRENRYIEDTSALKPLEPVSSSAAGQAEERLSALCILEAQKSMMKDTRSFAKCSKNDLRPKEDYGKPCASEAYHKYVERAFQAVVHCFGVPPKQMAAILTHESGFHINAQQNGQGSGISQMVGDVISGVNKEHFKHYQTKVNGFQACSQLAPFMERPMDPAYGKRCVALWPPENPVKNLIYGAMLYETNAKMIDRRIERSRARLQQVMSDVEYQALVDSIKILSHNECPMKIMTTLERFIKKKDRSLKASDFKIKPYEGKGEAYFLPGSFLEFLRAYHPVPGADGEKRKPEAGQDRKMSRRSVIASYLPKIFRDMEEVEALTGGQSCITPGLRKLYYP